jgi:hypothetical protein
VYSLQLTSTRSDDQDFVDLAGYAIRECEPWIHLRSVLVSGMQPDGPEADIDPVSVFVAL